SVDRRLALAIGAAAAISALVGAQIAGILSGRDLALALALFTACVSGISLAWPQTRRPIDLRADDPVADAVDDPAADALDDPAAGPVAGRGAASGAMAGGAAPDADGGGGATADTPRPYAYGQLRDALRLRVVPPAGRPARRPPPAADAPLAGAVIGGSIIGLLKGLFGVGGAFLILPVMSRVGRVPRDVALGSSLFAILVASLVAALRHWTLGNVDGSDLLALVPGGLFGSFVGARAARSMSPASIRRVFLGMMAASTVYLILFRSAYK
ncbi:MAG TPA: sulfite exporter TauE/SafE family protein, partial [Acidimicrobiia bacterium]|nr:sulfite exporter TauE/SafE family protein [Acidimicrobiia bacterium]